MLGEWKQLGVCKVSFDATNKEMRYSHDDTKKTLSCRAANTCFLASSVVDILRITFCSFVDVRCRARSDTGHVVRMRV